MTITRTSTPVALNSLNIGLTKVNKIPRIVVYDLRSLPDERPLDRIRDLTLCATMHIKDEITKGDAAKYYIHNRHKDWCVFTHEYVDYNTQ